MALMVLEDFVQNIADVLILHQQLNTDIFQDVVNVHHTEHGNVNIVMIIQFLKHVDSWKSINENFIQFLKEVHGIKV